MIKAQVVKRPVNPDPRPRTQRSRQISPKSMRRAAKDARRLRQRWEARQRRLALIEHWKWHQAALERGLAVAAAETAAVRPLQPHIGIRSLSCAPNHRPANTADLGTPEA